LATPADGVDPLGGWDHEGLDDGCARLLDLAVLDARRGQIEPGERAALHVGRAA
jgi:hypothetical protein